MPSWEVDFMTEDESGEMTTFSTGAGGQFEIMSFVTASLKAFIKAKKPKAITYTASKLDANNRTRVYLKLFSRLLPNFKFTTKDREDGDYEISVGVAQ